MTVQQARKEIKNLVERARAAGYGDGIVYGASIRLLPLKDREAYLKLVRQLRRATKFTTREVLDTAGNKVFTDEPCEHCLLDGMTKLIKAKGARVGLASGHANGDFVCIECHPWITMKCLEWLVAAESA